MLSKVQPACLALEAITDESVGGKATGLAELMRLGLPVPPAFVICNASVGTYPDELADSYQALGAGKVAVRSSAIGEDGDEASFAGQYETLLNIEGIDALQQAIDQCVESLYGQRATAYQHEQAELTDVTMCVVVQRMVNARSAGVLFTADPVSGRHDRLVIDAVQGLGEALVSGEATPDHYELDRNNATVMQDLVAEQPVLSNEQLLELAMGARGAVAAMGHPLDMEWAFDSDGSLYWLQGRPITTLPSDLNELDTPIPDSQVITRCNVGEMMPGAVCPLTFSVQGRAIEHGMQHMHVSWGVREGITQEWTQINQFFGHLFINMSGGLESAATVSINTADTMAQSLCGRPVPELVEPGKRAPAWRRWYGSWKFLRYCMQAQRYITEFETRFKHMRIVYTDDSKSMMQEMDKKFPWLCETNEVHLRSSAVSGVMEGVIQGMVSGGNTPPSVEQQAEAARLLAGADNVESAVLVEQLDEVVDCIAGHKDVVAAFQSATPGEALAWLSSDKAGAAAQRFADFLVHHGHRSFRELCVREKAWIDEPEKLIVTMQASVAARFADGYTAKRVSKIDMRELSRGLRFWLPRAHSAVRRREHTKSILVEATHRLKRGYRHLGKMLEREGALADADLVFFLTHNELKDFCVNPTVEVAELTQARRVALLFHEKMEFDDVYVGKPEPLVWQPSDTSESGMLVGRPVSRGVVEGRARVALTLEEAAGLQPGEILVAPITDVGWTPYFSLIAGLATDVGSAVSHGAVIAREYGLPAIVNLRSATREFNTGDLVRLDADKGVLSRIQ